ncbi:lycopene cyclase family protein [Gandjariella thermophila]|uniref:lycopene cyclase family protein n=1 Tax=Gandjariella thermophila TaxID=1931992 RepID=UPI0010FA5D1B|nr:lycopene cyclase family protein [Gandjariella thermophila]
MVDVLVAGGGPAGWAVAASCAARGLSTTLVDEDPWRDWPATYAAWADELPADLPAAAVAARPAVVRAVAAADHRITREYLVLRNAGLRDHLTHPDVRVRAGRVVGAEHGRSGSTVRLADGHRLAAAVVVDASGVRRALTGGRPRRPPAEQTAAGLVLPATAVYPVLGPGEALLMDWTHPAGPAGDAATFLYAVPLAAGRVLVEETSLARRPGLPREVLRDRLRMRLGALGVPVADAMAEEHVRIPLDLPLPRPGRAVPFGVAAGMVHPATGYHVASALRTAPAVAAAVATGLRHGPAAAARVAWHAVWPPAALAVHALRRRGLAALLAVPPREVPAFFELFFRLAEDHQRAYLSGRTDLAGTAGAMAALFAAAGWPLRGRLAWPGPHRTHR